MAQRFLTIGKANNPNSKEVPTSTKVNGHRTEYKKAHNRSHSWNIPSNMELKGGLKLHVNEQKSKSDI